jgi:lysine N6-hydroxylase
MNSVPHVNLAGVGLGPFNLSLASLLQKSALTHHFFEKKEGFGWHPEMMFDDSYMQTSFLKDLVTPVDPTSPYSFVNYLVENALFYSFMNTGRTVASRREFEMYFQWVASKLEGKLSFGTGVQAVEKHGSHFRLFTDKGEYTADHLCVATGLSARVPAAATDFIGPKLFHAKSGGMKDLKVEGLRVVVVGGGQTGLEIFRNTMLGRWGRPASVHLATIRQNLEPLDESAFTNEYFTPPYVDEFWGLPEAKKEAIVRSQKLASDGNTPGYIQDVYKDLYWMKHVKKDPLEVRILAQRRLTGVRKAGGEYTLTFRNSFLDQDQELKADLVILATGFSNDIPRFLDPIRGELDLDEQGRFRFEKSFAVKWSGAPRNRIYALNFSRHSHGISEPQTSLMSWRSASIINDLSPEPIYLRTPSVPNFIEYT